MIRKFQNVCFCKGKLGFKTIECILAIQLTTGLVYFGLYSVSFRNSVRNLGRFSEFWGLINSESTFMIPSVSLSKLESAMLDFVWISVPVLPKLFEMKPLGLMNTQDPFLSFMKQKFNFFISNLS